MTFVTETYLNLIQITFNMLLYDIFLENMLQADFEPSDWLFTQIALISERNGLWGHMRAHFIAIDLLFQTVYHT